MARLIDADVLIEWLRIVPLENGMINPDVVVEFIRAMPDCSGWISVNDKLPTSIVNKVLVWLEHEDLNGYIGFGHYEKYKGQEIWYDLEHNEAFSIRGYAVTHWMPLPEPPQEVENETRN